MRGNETCVDCPSSLICNFGVGTERGHIYVCSTCGVADFVINATALHDMFLRKTGCAMGNRNKGKRTYRIPAECPMLKKQNNADEASVFRPVAYVCAECFNKVFPAPSEYDEYNDAQYAHTYWWLHGRSKKRRTS